MFTAITLAASVIKDESQLAAQPYAVDASNMRSENGKFQTKYGQELASTTALTGVCRGIHTWADLSRVSWAAFGTHLRLQAMDSDGALTDITPVTERGELSSAFSTTSGSTLLTVRDDSHGLVADQLVTFPGTSSAGGLTITGDYTVSTVISSSAYGVTTSSALSTSSGQGGTAIDYEIHLAPGNLDSLGGLGYGTGGYGTGGYGAAGTGSTLDARTWSLTNWGQNLIANPAWGGIYEWAPETSASELVTNGDFTSSSSWTAGSGWSVASGRASAQSLGGSLSQSITTSQAAWHLLDFDISTVVSGTLQALLGTSTIQTYTTVGTKKSTFFAPFDTAQTLYFQGTFNGAIDKVSVKVLTDATIIPEAPTMCGSVFVTAERNLVACGTINEDTSVFDPMHVRWTDRENNRDWEASPSNLAGGYTLSHGSRIVRGLPGNRENLIFTNTSVYTMRASPDPAVVYSFDLLGEGCGLIGPNAVVSVNGTFYWIAPTGEFYRYAGGAIEPLPNGVERDFWDNLANVQGVKIFGHHLAMYNQATFIYPDERDGVECSRSIDLNYTNGTWVTDYTTRTAYADAGVFPFPIAADADGSIYYQEKDFSNDGAARQTSLTSSYFMLGDGETFVRVMGFRPDFDDLQGGVSFTFYSRDYPNGPERTYGPFSVTNATKRISTRINGRQIKFKITTDDAPSFYRLGKITFDVQQSGQKR